MNDLKWFFLAATLFVCALAADPPAATTAAPGASSTVPAVTTPAAPGAPGAATTPAGGTTPAMPKLSDVPKAMQGIPAVVKKVEDTFKGAIDNVVSGQKAAAIKILGITNADLTTTTTEKSLWSLFGNMF